MVSEFVDHAAFSNAGSSKVSGVENDAKFRTYWPRQDYRRVGWDLYTNCWSTYATTEPQE